MRGCSNPILVAAVREGMGSNEGDPNPYEQGDKKYLAWNRGYDSARSEEELQRHRYSQPFWRRILCQFGFHSMQFKQRIPGRPKIGKNFEIIGRDLPSFKYECPHCLDYIVVDQENTYKH